MGISALLERNCYIEFGHSDIYPNIYSMLIGNAGTRKSSAIKLMKKLMMAAGYETIAAERTSKEKFLHDLAHSDETGPGSDDILEQNIFGKDSADTSEICPMFIAADEANDFFGVNNIEFLSMLGSLWDWNGVYENRIKTGKSDWIPNPTISILSGNTPTGFASAFPSSILGQGFFSRILLVYGEPSGRKITIPRRPDVVETGETVRLLAAIRASSQGPIGFTSEATELLDAIYQTTSPLTDPRFESYSNRRIIHLLKLAMVVCSAKFERSITPDTLIQANTYLTYAERLMPKALGEFGKAKSSDISHKILEYVRAATLPVSGQDIWKQVDQELENPNQMGEIIRKLLFAEKIQSVVSSAGSGFLPIRKEIDVIEDTKDGKVDFKKYLSEEELRVRK